MDFPKHIVAACGLIINNHGDVLLMRHPRRGWEPPGGQVEEGESLIDGVCREIVEETGIHVEVNSLAGVYSNLSEPCKVIFGFTGRMVRGELTTSEESLEVGWFPRDKVLSLVTHPAIHDRVGDLLGFSGQVIYRVYRSNPYEIISESAL